MDAAKSEAMTALCDRLLAWADHYTEAGDMERAASLGSALAWASLAQMQLEAE